MLTCILIMFYSLLCFMIDGAYNSQAKRSTGYLCQITTANQPPVLPSLMKSPECFQRRDLISSYINTGYAVQPREPPVEINHYCYTEVGSKAGRLQTFRPNHSIRTQIWLKSSFFFFLIYFPVQIMHVLWKCLLCKYCIFLPS